MGYSQAKADACKSTVRFYGLAGGIFAVLALFNHMVYLPYGRQWDADVMLECSLHHEPIVDGHYAFEAIVMTWLEAGLAAVLLITALIAAYRRHRERLMR